MTRLDPDSDYAYDVTNQPGGVTICRACRYHIDHRAIEWNGWSWHPDCLPPHVTAGLMDELETDIVRDDR